MQKKCKICINMQPKYAQICTNMQIKYAKICKKYAKIYKSMFLHMVHLYALPTLLMDQNRRRCALQVASEQLMIIPASTTRRLHSWFFDHNIPAFISKVGSAYKCTICKNIDLYVFAYFLHIFAYFICIFMHVCAISVAY